MPLGEFDNSYIIIEVHCSDNDVLLFNSDVTIEVHCSDNDVLLFNSDFTDRRTPLF